MKIQILMSTYNGERYLRAQLDSIANQNIPEQYLLIRDDGSTDSTIEILEEYQKKYSWIKYYAGPNVGVQKSFLDLIQKASCQSSYFALSDQDDIWMPKKLLRAIMCLQQMEETFDKKVPLLYCGTQELVDENLNVLHTTVSRIVRRISFGNALVQNICVGCTAVGNQSLMKLLQNFLPLEPQNIIMHDWWLYMVASCFGKVYYDPESYIKYRQHEHNTFGVKLNQRELWRYRLNELVEPRGDIYKQVILFLKTYNKLLNISKYQNNRMLAEKLLKSETNVFSRLKLVIDFRYFRQKKSDDIIFRLIVLMGKL